eukprot:scaffold542965_cov15-Prasinocladus_malaysianus.AAC.1
MPQEDALQEHFLNYSNTSLTNNRIDENRRELITAAAINCQEFEKPQDRLKALGQPLAQIEVIDPTRLGFKPIALIQAPQSKFQAARYCYIRRGNCRQDCVPHRLCEKRKVSQP